MLPMGMSPAQESKAVCMPFAAWMQGSLFRWAQARFLCTDIAAFQQVGWTKHVEVHRARRTMRFAITTKVQQSPCSKCYRIS